MNVTKHPKDLSSLISSGRAGKGVPKSRGQVLESLLRKRAAAWRGGMDDLESKLRSQILWALPVEKPADADAEESARPDPANDDGDGPSVA
jgi:hypothetical protein